MAAKRTYYDWVTQSLLPPWLLGDLGGQLGGFIGLAADAVSELATVAALAPWLRQSASPNDALPLVGAESSMPRYATEDDDTYRARLLGRWDAWPKGGTRPTPSTGGVCDQLSDFGLTGVHMIRNYDWRLAGPPGSWTNYSRFWIVIDGHDWSPTYIGGGTVGDGTIGSTATALEVVAIRAIITKWKAGHDICPAIIVVFSPTIIGDLGETIGGGTLGGEAIQWPGTV